MRGRQGRKGRGGHNRRLPAGRCGRGVAADADRQPHEEGSGRGPRLRGSSGDGSGTGPGAAE